MREGLIEALREAEDWLYDQADDSDTPFIDKLKSLKTLSDPIASRYLEQTELPKAMTAALNVIKGAREQITAITANRPWVPAEDLEQFKNMTAEGDAWLQQKMNEQAALNKYDEMALTSQLIYSTLNPLVELGNRLSKIRKPIEPVPKTNKTKASRAKTNASASNETATGEESPVAGDADGIEPTNGEGASAGAGSNAGNEGQSSNAEAGSSELEPHSQSEAESTPLSSHDDL